MCLCKDIGLTFSSSSRQRNNKGTVIVCGPLLVSNFKASYRETLNPRQAVQDKMQQKLQRWRRLLLQ